MARLKNILSAVTGFLAAVAASVVILSTLVESAGTSSSVMLSAMKKTAPPSVTCLAEDKYADVVNMITAYLSGKTDSFEYYADEDNDGEEENLFNEKEAAHMADCKGLFELLRKVQLVSAFSTLVLLFAGASLKNRRSFFAGALSGTLLTIVGLGVAAAMAAIDFDKVFVAFHHWAFTNDLWLMNPQTDLIIRLMPTEFFVTLVVQAGVVFACITMLILIIEITALHCRKRK